MRRVFLIVPVVAILSSVGGAEAPPYEPAGASHAPPYESAGYQAAGAVREAPGPRLVVVLVVDQMRADYLTTFAARWQKGFRTLLARGASFTNAEYPYWSTITCAGHSSISTGTLPRTHGMVLNRWWDRADKRVITCNDDR